MKRLTPMVLGVALSLFAGVPAPPAAAQGITTEQADAILRELREIRRLLERPQAGAPPAPREPARLVIEQRTPAMGRPDAPLTVVEFTDLECPFCRQFHATAFAQLKSRFIDTGKVRFVSHDFPLDVHAHARTAAHAVRCAGEQDRYWEMRHLVMTRESIDDDALVAIAGGLGLALDRFRECHRTQKYRTAIDADVAYALSVGVSGTPTFVVGRTTDTGVDGETIVGAVPYVVFEQKLNDLLGAR